MVNRNLEYLEEGVTPLPDDADLPTFLMTGGKRTEAKITLSEKLTLKKLFDLYDAAPCTQGSGAGVERLGRRATVC